MGTIRIAILSSVIPFSLELEVLRRLSSRVFGVLMSIEPAVATLTGVLVLREAIGLREILVIALIISASVGVPLDTTTLPTQGIVDVYFISIKETVQKEKQEEFSLCPRLSIYHPRNCKRLRKRFNAFKL